MAPVARNERRGRRPGGGGARGDEREDGEPRSRDGTGLAAGLSPQVASRSAAARSGAAGPGAGGAAPGGGGGHAPGAAGGAAAGAVQEEAPAEAARAEVPVGEAKV